MLKFKLPSVYTILFLLTVLIAALTWVVPAGQYEMANNALLGKLVPISGTYHQVESSPQGLKDVLLAPIKGFYDPESNQSRAIDVALFVLIIGGFFGVVNHTKSIDSAIYQITVKLQGREIWLIPTLMGLFALGGTLIGMAEETLPFYTLVIPVMIAAGYDSITGVAVVMIGAGIGAYMDHQERDLRRELIGSGVQVRRDGDQIHLIMPGNLTFNTAEYSIRSSFYDTLNSVAKVLYKYKDTNLDIIGHTDSVGSEEDNYKLSQQRAYSVADYLASQNVPSQRLTPVGAGESQPVADNMYEAGRSQNRRVELYITAFDD